MMANVSLRQIKFTLCLHTDKILIKIYEVCKKYRRKMNPRAAKNVEYNENLFINNYRI